MLLVPKSIEFNDANRELISRLRVLAWKVREPKMSSYNGTMIDWHDSVAKHFGVFDKDRLVAAGRVNIAQKISEVPDLEAFSHVIRDNNEWPLAIFSRLVVHPDYGQREIPKLMREPRDRLARISGCSKIFLWSRKSKKPHNSFLLEGYREEGLAIDHHLPQFREIFQDEPIAIMVKKLREGDGVVVSG